MPGIFGKYLHRPLTDAEVPIGGVTEVRSGHVDGCGVLRILQAQSAVSHDSRFTPQLGRRVTESYTRRITCQTTSCLLTLN